MSEVYLEIKNIMFLEKRPMTTREIMIALDKKFNRKLSIHSVSSYLSQLKTNGQIKRFTKISAIITYREHRYPSRVSCWYEPLTVDKDTVKKLKLRNYAWSQTPSAEKPWKRPSKQLQFEFMKEPHV